MLPSKDSPSQIQVENPPVSSAAFVDPRSDSTKTPPSARRLQHNFLTCWHSDLHSSLLPTTNDGDLLHPLIAPPFTSRASSHTPSELLSPPTTRTRSSAPLSRSPPPHPPVAVATSPQTPCREPTPTLEAVIQTTTTPRRARPPLRGHPPTCTASSTPSDPRPGLTSAVRAAESSARAPATSSANPPDTPNASLSGAPQPLRRDTRATATTPPSPRM